MLDGEDAARKVKQNWASVCQQVAAACEEASRDVHDVTIVGVSKYVSPELAWHLYAAGCHDLGENRPQQLWEKAEYFTAPGRAPESKCWHQIGHLQRNKIRRTLPWLKCLHSLDSERLAAALHAELTQSSAALDVLVEVNVTQDESKTGLTPDQAKALLERSSEWSTLHFRGLMAMSTRPEPGVDPYDQARREFSKVRELRDELNAAIGSHRLTELSMGMSGDFRAAIAEGATLVRIGTSIWSGLL